MQVSVLFPSMMVESIYAGSPVTPSKLMRVILLVWKPIFSKYLPGYTNTVSPGLAA